MTSCCAVRRYLIAEAIQQQRELVITAVHIPDDVERPVPVAQVVPQPFPRHRGSSYVVLAGQHVDPVEAFPAQAFHAAAELGVLLPQDVVAEVTVGPQRISCRADLLGYVKDDSHGQDVMLARERDECPTGRRLHARGVDDGQPADRQPLGRDEVQDVEGVLSSRLIVLVITYQAAAEV